MAGTCGSKQCGGPWRSCRRVSQLLIQTALVRVQGPDQRRVRNALAGFTTSRCMRLGMNYGSRSGAQTEAYDNPASYMEKHLTRVLRRSKKPRRSCSAVVVSPCQECAFKGPTRAKTH